MKLLVVIGIILGILFFYFVANTDKTFSVSGANIPQLISDIPKWISDKVSGVIKGGLNPETLANEITGGAGQGLITNIVDKTKNFISDAAGKAGELIKAPIQDKISEYFCGQK